jgi:hypothetical protein
MRRRPRKWQTARETLIPKFNERIKEKELLMTFDFRIDAIGSEYLDRIRASGVDDFGNSVVTLVNESANGTPLRCCLREAEVGEEVVLIAYQPAQLGGPYKEVGPVFIHAKRCDGYEAPGSYPEGFRHRQLLFRAYDITGTQVDNKIANGNDAEVAISDLFAMSHVADVHARNVLAGCFMFKVQRDRN